MIQKIQKIFSVMVLKVVWQRGFWPEKRQDTTAGLIAAPSCRQDWFSERINETIFKN